MADLTVADIMDSAVVAARKISGSGRNRLPVGDGDRLVGVVTRVDCLEALSRTE